ncbi:MAG: DNA polymerase III subunit alpha [Lysobacterales bacterium]
MPDTFVHLHLHSEYSLIDSTIRIKQLVAACVAARMPAVAVTDDSNLFALVKFYQAAERAGIKPIIGCDLWLSAPEQAPERVTLLCRDRDGYLRLSRLLSDAYRNRPRHGQVSVPRAALLADNQGLIALLGPASAVIQASASEHSQALLEPWRRAFDDRLYLELLRTGKASESADLARALELAESADLPVVASNDVRFLAADDFEAHEARVCISSGRVLNDPKRPRDYSAGQYLKSPAEMAECFADLPSALANSVELAKRCNLELEFGKYHLPAFPVPSEHSADSFIRAQAEQGLAARLASAGCFDGCTEQDYAARLNREIEVIVSMGFAGYFLIVADFINWAKHNDIPVGPGRGSGAGSLVAWALGITDLDPIRYDLLFERFLNPERVSMPDFDIDFCMDKRDRVIQYVAERYGRERVSQIITYGTMAAKGVLRDTGRVLGMGYNQVDGVAKLIPRTLDITLDQAIAESSELAARIESEDEVATLVELARKLEDLTRNAGTHAGGVVIAPSDLTDFSPLYCIEQGAPLVTQFDKDDVEAVGLVKFDFLGLRTLTIIDWAVKAIDPLRAAAGAAPLDMLALPLDDPETYALLARGETTAVFQFESRGMKDYIRKLQPELFEDLIALAALYRPGPLNSGMVDDFINRRHGRALVSYPHPSLEAILKPTYGVIVYQEQVMQIAQVLAGYSLGGADLLRRAMGKKKPEEMAKERVKFEAGAADNGIQPRVASAIFDLMEKFAEYGFNKSHSAAYALIAYQTAWLKAHYPAQFMAAVLSADMDNTDKLGGLLDDARAFGLAVAAPDCNGSGYRFEATDRDHIRYGLGAIKGVGQAACEAIVAERERHGRYRDLADFCRRVEAGKINKRVLEALILSGAMDSLGETRATLMAHLPEAMKAAEQHARNHESGQVDIFGGAQSAITPLSIQRLPEWPIGERLRGERDTLGHFLSGHPIDACRPWLKQLTSTSLGEIEALWRSSQGTLERHRGRMELPVVLGGIVAAGLRRHGDTLAFAPLDDGSGRVEMTLGRELLHEATALFAKDEVVIVEGGLSADEFSGGFQIRVRQAWSLAQALERFARGLRISVSGAGAALVEQLADTLSPLAGGTTPVRIGYRNAHAQCDLQLSDDWRIRAVPEILDRLKTLPGIAAVELVLGRAGGGR